MINILEYRAIGWYKWSVYSFITLVAQFWLMIFLQGHYMIDMFTGVVMAHYAYIIGERYSHYIDVWIFKIPFVKRFPRYFNLNG